MTTPFVLGTTQRLTHCETPSAPTGTWHRPDHQLLAQATCPDCGAVFQREVARERVAPDPPADEEPPQWTLADSQWLTEPVALPSVVQDFRAAAAARGWTTRAHGARGVEAGEHPYQSVGIVATHDDPLVLVAVAWLRRTSGVSDSWKSDLRQLCWPGRQSLTHAELRAVLDLPTLACGVVAAATQPVKPRATSAARTRSASAKQREATIGG